MHCVRKSTLYVVYVANKYFVCLNLRNLIVPEAACEAQIVQIPAITAGEATGIIKSMALHSLPQEVKIYLGRCLDTKVSGQKVNQSKKAGPVGQSCLFIHNMLPQWLWHTICDPSRPQRVVFAEVGEWCRSFGLSQANEPTFLDLLACIVLGRLSKPIIEATFRSDTSKQHIINVDDAYVSLTQLKEAVRPHRKMVKLEHWGKVRFD